ncbi:MAG: FHA domain-containing protein [Anaerolineales bacterium]
MRIEWAAQYPDGTVVLHISVPRGQVIDDVVVNINGTTQSLQVSPEPLPVAQWFVLDASGGMLNAYPRVGAALERFLQGSSASVSGLVTYDDTVDVVQLTDQTSEIVASLEDYIATANVPGCVGDALAALEDAPPEPNRARRILWVASTLSRQGPCQADPFQMVQTPVDAIIIADSVDDVYQDIVESSGGELREANLNTIQARFNEVRTEWSRPIYAANGTLPPNTETATARITLESGERAELQLRFQSVPDNPPLIAANPTPTAQPGGGIVIEPVATELPSVTSSPTNTRIPLPTPTPSDVARQDTPTVATAAPTEPEADALATEASTARPTPTDVPPDEATEGPAEATPSPNEVSQATEAAPQNDEAPTDAPTAAPEETESAVPLTVAEDPPAADASDDESDSFNPLILVGGGLVGLAALLLGAYVVLSRRPATPTVQPVASAAPSAMMNTFQDVTEYEATFQESAASEPYDFYASAGATTPQPALARRAPATSVERQQAELAAQHTDLLSEEDEMLVTEMLSDTDFQQMRQQSAREVVGWLRLDMEPPRHFELFAGPALVGRKPSCDVVITDDSSVSGEHLRLEWEAEGTMWVSTISKTNPAMVSGLILPPGEARPLQPQDVIQLSPKTRLIYLQRLPETPVDQAPLDDEDDPDGVTLL